jgi:hypothetical protein
VQAGPVGIALLFASFWIFFVVVEKVTIFFAVEGEIVVLVVGAGIFYLL